VNDCEWLFVSRAGASPSEHALRARLVQRWFVWLVTDVVDPCLKAHFYVTDTGLHRNRVFFFRKPVSVSFFCKLSSSHLFDA
jgi:hypothetical protein